MSPEEDFETNATICGEPCQHDDPPGTPNGQCCALTCILQKGHCPTPHRCANGHRTPCAGGVA